MQIKITVPITFVVDFETDGEDVNQEWLTQDTRYAVVEALDDDVLAERLVDEISDHTGWVINSMSMTAG